MAKAAYGIQLVRWVNNLHKTCFCVREQNWNLPEIFEEERQLLDNICDNRGWIVRREKDAVKVFSESEQDKKPFNGVMPPARSE